MLNGHNGLTDRWAGRSVCITNQLAMSQLIVMLAQRCATIDFVNINTDGIMFEIDRSEDALAASIVDRWCELTGFGMERDEFARVIQKDVNNYIGIKTDGKTKTKGGFVSLYKGGNFKSNSLSIIDKAVVDFLVDGIPPEETIRACTDVFAFQQIAKMGSTYEGAYHYVNGERVPLQKVNRIYAVRDPKYGRIMKGKWITEKRKKDNETGQMVTVAVDPPQWSEANFAGYPEHAFVDNECTLTVGDLDLDYYIEIARARIDKYINLDPKVERKLQKIQEVITVMATKLDPTDVSTWNLHYKLIEARSRFAAAGIKKTGVNRYAEYKYFTLDDIIPVKLAIFGDLGLLDVISFGTEVATLTLINADNPEETLEFMTPLREDESLIKNPVQKLGAIETYIRRYLYMLVLDIVEADTVEAVAGKPEDETPAPAPKSKRPATPEEREEVKRELTNVDGEATPVQIKSIKSGLKKLRDKPGDYESFVAQAVKRMKSGISKAEAEALLVEVGEKIAE